MERKPDYYVLCYISLAFFALLRATGEQNPGLVAAFVHSSAFHRRLLRSLGSAMVKVDPKQTVEVEPRWLVVKRWLMRHKVESTAIIVVIVGIVVVVTSFVGGSKAAAIQQPPVDPPVDGNSTSPPSVKPSDPADDEDEPSSVTSSILSSPIMNELTLLTDPAILYDETSPQYKAAEWLIAYDSLKLDATSPNLRQRYALAALYTATGGGWVTSQGWTTCNAVPPESRNTSVTGVQCVVREGKVLCADQGSFELCSYIDEFGATVESKRFLSATNECEWYGIRCKDDSVIEINICKFFYLNGFLKYQFFP